MQVSRGAQTSKSESQGVSEASSLGYRLIYISVALVSIIFAIALWVTIVGDPAQIIASLSVGYLVVVTVFGTYRGVKAFRKTQSKLTKGDGQTGGEVGQGHGQTGESTGQAVGEGASQTVEQVGEGASQAVQQAGGSTGQAIEETGQVADQAIQETEQGAGQATQQSVGEVRDALERVRQILDERLWRREDEQAVYYGRKSEIDPPVSSRHSKRTNYARGGAAYS
jgi:peroxiredoxin family protein